MLVGLAGIGIALLALGRVGSPWRDREAGTGVAVPAPHVLAPDANVLRGALTVSFGASTAAPAFAEAHDRAPLAFDLAVPSFAANARPVALPEPPPSALGLAIVAGLGALGCRRHAR